MKQLALLVIFFPILLLSTDFYLVHLGYNMASTTRYWRYNMASFEGTNMHETTQFENCVYDIGNSYYWASTNWQSEYSAALFSPKGHRLTEFQYQIMWDSVTWIPYKTDTRDDQCIFVHKGPDGNRKCVLLYMDGSEIPIDYNQFRPCSYWSIYGSSFKLKNQKETILDYSTKKRVQTIEYDKIVGHTQFPIVRDGNKWGIIDMQGNIITPPQYDNISSCEECFRHYFFHNTFQFSNGITNIVVELSTGKELFSTTNKIQSACDLQSDTSGKKIYNLLTERWEIISPNQEESTNTFFIYNTTSINMGPNRNYRTHIPICKNNKWGFVDKDGNQIVPCIYEQVKTVRDGQFPAKLNGKWGVFSLDGSCIISNQFLGIMDNYELVIDD